MKDDLSEFGTEFCIEFRNLKHLLLVAIKEDIPFAKDLDRYSALPVAYGLFGDIVISLRKTIMLFHKWDIYGGSLGCPDDLKENVDSFWEDLELLGAAADMVTNVVAFGSFAPRDAAEEAFKNLIMVLRKIFKV